MAYVFYILEIKKLHRITNHPVHVYDEDGNQSPSAFIPFCQFGDTVKAMGRTSNLVKIPVCNSFKAKLFYNQLCYEVDVKETLKLKGKSFNLRDLKLGLSLLVDTNFNRQYSMKEKKNTATLKETIGNKILRSGIYSGRYYC